MLDFLQTQSTYPVEAVHLDGNSVTFICEEAIPTNDLVKVEDSSGNVAGVILSSSRRTDLGVGVWLCFAQITEGTLEVQVEWPEPLRASPRLEVGLRVRSEQLPGFSALTKDLSQHGMQLRTDGPLRVGESVALTLDLDGERKSLNLTASVRWSKVNAPCRAGLHFLHLDPETEQRLSEFLRHRTDPDQVLGRFSDSLSELDQESVTVNTLAQFVDAYREEHFLTLKLQTAEDVIDLKFCEPKVLQDEEVEDREIHRITSEAREPGISLFTFYDQANQITLQLKAQPPEITIRRRMD